MSSSYRDNGSAVRAKLEAKWQTGAMNLAHGILAASVATTPYKTGDLRKRTRVTALSKGARVQWLVPYAAVQNRGSRLGHPFRHYTTPGTGKEFVQKGIKAAMAHLKDYFK